MELSKREKIILRAIVNHYTKDGLPVGSKLLANQLPMRVSSATIRNEMVYLESLNLINKTHSSSGRVPTIKGYRYYVDHLIQPNPINKNDEDIIQKTLNGNFSKMDEIVKKSANILSDLTHYTALTLRPEQNNVRHLKGFRLVALSNYQVMAILVTDNNEVQNQIFNISKSISGDQLEAVVRLINDKLTGMSIPDVIKKLQTEIPAEITKYIHTPSGFLSTFNDVLDKAARNQFYIGGELNLLNFTDSSNTKELKSIYSLLDKTDDVSKFIDNHDGPVSVKIGNEIRNHLFNHYSLITGTYDAGQFGKGIIAVLGPTRMPYSKVIGIVSAFREELAKKLITYYNNYYHR
ncbi:heat-inducible transcription repressor HrcA [Philodulcilactobacillus myokoensis]|uniref:Heat-inducible transcription repressor HrcA n=1 Tax=Philodulcilactobacillus myokoensis TaxID=2929573 RepID=A0A9W6B1I4_9LACO|nr:heat-inducible transcription repressor HrcA [Philodulcilactobacillus myokoensis]